MIAAAAPSLRLAGVSKRFGAREVLRDLSVALGPGEALGLVGPNGAGKTTLMRLIIGLARPSAGSVELFGAAPAKAALARVGYMAQAEAVYPDLSPEENVRLFGSLCGLAEPALAGRVEQALRLTDLWERRRDRVDALSGGMRRRVSLACAVVHDPALLLLDEPTVGVDPELRAAFWEHFLALRARGAALLVSTHHMDEARRCDRLLLLREGRAIAEGAPAELLARAGADTLEDAFLRFARRGAAAPA